MLLPGRNSWGSPAIPLMEVWFGFLSHPKLNASSSEPPVQTQPQDAFKRETLLSEHWGGSWEQIPCAGPRGSQRHVQEGCGKGEESSRRPQPLVPFSLQSWGSLPWAGCPRASWGSVGSSGGPVWPAVPRLLVPKPFSSACAMWVVTELGRSQRGPFPVSGGETQTNIAEVKVSFLIPWPGFSFFPAFPPLPPGPSLCSHPPSVSLFPLCHKKVTVSLRGQFSYAILYTVLHV